MPFPAVIDSTILSSYSACGRLFELAHVESYKRTSSDEIHLHAGGAYATGMETCRLAYLQGNPSSVCLEAGRTALAEAYGDFDSSGQAKSKDRMIGAFDFYWENYPLETDPAQIIHVEGMPGVEFSFAIPLPLTHPDTGAPILYTGRLDAVVNFCGGLYLLDDKTTSSLGEKWARQWELRSQFTGYAWAFRELGHRSQGTLVRGVSILKTKYDLAQAIITQPDWKIDRWYENALVKIKHMIEDYKAGSYVYNLGDSCNAYGSCPYKSVCLSPDPQALLDTYYEVKVWNPLKK